ncbi:MAG TPA: RNA polymerase sigma factor [Gemmatimonadaceae bacterium]|nr:RNA polymerase sigma factor [Gemmatimonadaceae bacterium]
MMAATLDVMASGTADEQPSDVALAAAGDRRAFERLYRTHVDRVFSICVRMCGSRVRGEELTQDVFVRVWEKLPLFRGESAFSTWLHRVAVNVALNDRKVQSRERSRTADPDDDVRDGGDSLGSVAAAPVAERLDLEAAIALLPPGARKVFVLHDVEGFTHEEIAEEMGVTAGGTKSQLHRARMLLREALSR